MQAARVPSQGAHLCGVWPLGCKANPYIPYWGSAVGVGASGLHMPSWGCWDPPPAVSSKWSRKRKKIEEGCEESGREVSAPSEQGTRQPRHCMSLGPGGPHMGMQTTSSTCWWQGDVFLLPRCSMQGAAGAVALLYGATSRELQLPSLCWKQLGSC